MVECLGWLESAANTESLNADCFSCTTQSSTVAF